MTPHPDASSDRRGTSLANPRRVRADAVGRCTGSVPDRDGDVVRKAPEQR